MSLRTKDPPPTITRIDVTQETTILVDGTPRPDITLVPIAPSHCGVILER